MKLNVVHDEHGEIISISKLTNLKEAGSKFTKVGMVPGRGQRLIEIELTGEAEKKPLAQLHKEYRVDITTLKLEKREKF